MTITNPQIILELRPRSAQRKDGVERCTFCQHRTVEACIICICKKMWIIWHPPTSVNKNDETIETNVQLAIAKQCNGVCDTPV